MKQKTSDLLSICFKAGKAVKGCMPKADRSYRNMRRGILQRVRQDTEQNAGGRRQGINPNTIEYIMRCAETAA